MLGGMQMVLEVKMSKEYSDRQINSMITFLRVNKIAEVQYIDRQ